jgi:hypothetical protein
MIAVACAPQSKPSPLPDLHGITRVAVTRFGESMHEFRHPADSLRIAMLADALEKFPTGWTVSDDAPPHPNLGAGLMRDTALVAVIWVGSEFIAATSWGERRERRVSRTDELQLRALLDTATLIGVISKQSPKPPQN